MTNEELKKKIVDILQLKLQECPLQPHGIMYRDAAEYIADALIAAGIGDIRETEHRAEVAEMAFLILWNECKGKVGWGVDCTMWYKKRAEKELAEERE